MLAELTSRALERGEELDDLEVRRPSLEEVYLELTGMRIFLHELRGQLLLYTRSKELAFFTFLLPLILFVLLGSTYGNDKISGVRGADFLEAGMLGYGLVSTAFAGLAIFLVIRRESGILKRVRATPLPAWAYLAAVLTATLIAFAVSCVVHDRDRPAALLGPAADALVLARPDARARRGRLRGARARHDRGRPLGRRRVGDGERRLPADGVHLRRVLLAAFVSVSSCARSRMCFRSRTSSA